MLDITNSSFSSFFYLSFPAEKLSTSSFMLSSSFHVCLISICLFFSLLLFPHLGFLSPHSSSYLLLFSPQGSSSFIFLFIFLPVFLSPPCINIYSSFRQLLSLFRSPVFPLSILLSWHFFYSFFLLFSFFCPFSHLFFDIYLIIPLSLLLLLPSPSVFSFSHSLPLSSHSLHPIHFTIPFLLPFYLLHLSLYPSSTFLLSLPRYNPLHSSFFPIHFTIPFPSPSPLLLHH